jgi:hypothetical protein
VRRNEIFCARLVACGCYPDLNNLCFRVMLLAKLVWDMTCIVVEIETAFLNRDLDEEI